MSHLNPCPDICDSPPPRWCLRSIQVPRIASQFHPCPISNPAGSQDVCLTYIQALSHLHPGLKILQCTFSPPPRPRKMQINLIQAHIKLILVSGCVLHLRQCPASPTSRSQNSCLISIHVPAHFHPGPKIPISPSSMYSSTSAWVTTLVSHLQAFTSHIQPGLSFVSRLHPGHI